MMVVTVSGNLTGTPLSLVVLPTLPHPNPTILVENLRFGFCVYKQLPLVLPHQKVIT